MENFAQGLFSFFSGSLLSSQMRPTVPLEDPVLGWMRIVTLVVGVLALLIVTYTVFVRRRLNVTSKWLLLVGLAILPSFVLLSGNAILFEQSKQVDACAACHTMHPFVNDLRNPSSETLAARHFQNRWIPDNQCYYCHTDYHFFGQIQAKIDGMRHLYYYHTGRYKLPIRIAKPYQNSICLHCHGAAKKYQKIDLHEQLASDILANKTSCVECHSAVHPAPEQRAEK